MTFCKALFKIFTDLGKNASILKKENNGINSLKLLMRIRILGWQDRNCSETYRVLYSVYWFVIFLLVKKKIFNATDLENCHVEVVPSVDDSVL